MSTTSTRLGKASRIAGALALGIASLAACTGTEPAATPSVTPSPTVSVTPEPVSHLAWSLDVASETWSTAAIVDNIAYLGSNDGVFRAIDAADGTLLWEFATGGDIRAEALAADGVLYFPSDDGFLYALTLDGAEVWRSDIGNAPEVRDDYENTGSRPELVDGVLYVGSYDGNVYAVDAATGGQVWTFDTGGPVLTNIESGDGRIYASTYAGATYALVPATGEQIWERTTSGATTTHPAFSDGILITGSRMAFLQAFDASTGEKVWTQSFGGSWVQSGAVVYGDRIAVGSSDLGMVRGIETTTGITKWNAILGGWPWGVPAYSDGVVYATNIRLDYHLPWEAAVHAIDTENGQILWSEPTGAALEWYPDNFATYGAAAGPAVADTVIVVSGLNGVIYGFTK